MTQVRRIALWPSALRYFQMRHALSALTFSALMADIPLRHVYVFYIRNMNISYGILKLDLWFRPAHTQFILQCSISKTEFLHLKAHTMSIMSLISPLQAIAQFVQMPVRTQASIKHVVRTRTASPVLTAFKALIGSVKGNVASVYARVTEGSESRIARQQQAYLAQATDLYELEYRIKELDRSTRGNYGWM